MKMTITVTPILVHRQISQTEAISVIENGDYARLRLERLEPVKNGESTLLLVQGNIGNALEVILYCLAGIGPPNTAAVISDEEAQRILDIINEPYDFY